MLESFCNGAGAARQAEAVRAQCRVLLERAERGEGREIGAGVGFERTRRITGYLVGTLDRFNNAKRAEERDRVKHGVEYGPGR